jgi:catechol 2,3-dioxygenase-like lactoylglutathione lyase family enzyme
MLNDHPVYATIATGDLARARAFYEGTLGFSTEMEDPTGGVLYGSGGTRFLLYPSEFAGGPQQTVATWFVDDVEALVAELSGRASRSTVRPARTQNRRARHRRDWAI